jgi:hypothetical protein
MPALIVLFKLKPGASVEEYERWAAETDVPVVSRLDSVDSFRVFRLQSLLFGGGEPPYEYCEVIEVNDLDKLGEEIAQERIQAIAAQFQTFADDPVFIVAEQAA